MNRQNIQLYKSATPVEDKSAIPVEDDSDSSESEDDATDPTAAKAGEDEEEA